jgi:hypothetical protein
VLGEAGRRGREMPQIDQQERDRLIKLMGIFHPEPTRRRKAIDDSGERVVHYTSAENALKIISSQTMWLRNTNCMSDYSEVALGFSHLRQFFSDPGRLQRFVAAVNACYPNLGEDCIAHVNQWMPEIQANTYIASVSEHDPKENRIGRLSMWRAFGQSATARAAIVMNVPDPWEAEGLRLTLFPVEYTDHDEVEARLEQVIRDVVANVGFLQTFPRDRLQFVVFGLLTSIAVCSKHVGFKEEREWRVIYLPNYRRSDVITSSTQTIGGIPQIVYEMPLKEDPDHDVKGVGIPALIERIIIGPSMYPVPMAMAFIEALRKADVQDPEKRVFVSNIPIRW